MGISGLVVPCGSFRLLSGFSLNSAATNGGRCEFFWVTFKHVAQITSATGAPPKFMICFVLLTVTHVNCGRLCLMICLDHVTAENSRAQAEAAFKEAEDYLEEAKNVRCSLLI